MNKKLIAGCKLLSNDMLASFRRTGELYIGFFGCDSISTLYHEINEVYRKEACLLQIPIRKVVVDHDKNIMVYQEVKNNA